MKILEKIEKDIEKDIIESAEKELNLGGNLDYFDFSDEEDFETGNYPEAKSVESCYKTPSYAFDTRWFGY